MDGWQVARHTADSPGRHAVFAYTLRRCDSGLPERCAGVRVAVASVVVCRPGIVALRGDPFALEEVGALRASALYAGLYIVVVRRSGAALCLVFLAGAAFPVYAGALFFLKYYSGVPCLPAFRFPAP